MTRLLKMLAAALIVPTAAPIAWAQEFDPSAAEAGAEAAYADLERIFAEHPNVAQRFIIERVAHNPRLETLLASIRIPLFQAELRDGPSFGDPNGRTVIEFADYNCGACRQSAAAFRAFVEKHGLRVVMHESPIFGPDSEAAARVALAAARQDRYEDFHFAMMALDRRADEDSALDVAEKLGLDMARLRVDMASPKIQARIEADQDLHRTINVRPSTPNFVAAGRLVAGWSDIAVATALGVVEEASVEGGR